MNVTPPERSDRSSRFPRLAVVAAVLVTLFVGIGLGVLFQRERQPDRAASATKKADDRKPDKKAGSASTKTAGDQFAEYPPRFQDDPGNSYPAQFSTDTMYPRFNPSRRYYVTRCVPGKVDVKVRAEEGSSVSVGPYPARSGNFIAEARLLPGQDFQIGIESGGKATDYTVRCLPADFPQWSYRTYSKPPVGQFLVSFRPEPAATSRSWAVVFDQSGTPRWWQSIPFNSLGGQILSDGTVQLARGFGDGFGQDPRTAHEIRRLDGTLIRTMRTKGTPTDGHEFVLLPNGNALLMSYKPRLSVDMTSVGLGADDGVLDGEIQEVTPEGEVVWKWNSGDHFGLKETPERWWRKIRNNPHPDASNRVRYDHFHLNSVEPWGKQYVVSTRHTDKVFGISRQSGEVLWTLGGEPGPKALKVVGDDPYAEYPIGGNHDARIVDGDILAIHDNGTNLEQTNRPPRLVRYRLDLKERTATFLSEARDEEVAPSSHCCGGARAFGDGWVVAWGNSAVISGFGPDDELAFRLWLPVPTYRAVPVPDSVSLADLERGLESMEEGPPPAATPVRPIRELDP